MLGMTDEGLPELEEVVKRFPDTPEAEEAKKQLSYYQ
jgi:TolA-binding protein